MKTNRPFNRGKFLPSNQVWVKTNSLLQLTKYLAISLSFVILFTGCKKFDKNGLANNYAVNGKIKSDFTPGPDFSIAVIPDPQYCTGDIDRVGVLYHGKDQMFRDEISYILANKTALNIQYVVGVGDITDCGDDNTYYYVHQQWLNASSNGGMYRLDTAGIPYGLAVGNHEELPSQTPLTSRTTNFNSYFGVSHFSGQSYYGGSYSVYHSDSPSNPNDNANHFDLLDNLGGLNWIVIYVEYDGGLTLKAHPSATDNVYTWASNLLTTYASRKAIVVTHSVGSAQKSAWNDTTGVKTPSPFSGQTDYMYGLLKQHTNLFMLLGGHVGGEGYRQDTYNGRTKKSFISDYQFYKDKNGRNNGGDGYIRLMNISVINDLISVRTLSPYLIAGHDSLPTNPNRLPTEMTDQYSKFTRSLFHEQTTSRTCDFNNDGKTELSSWDPSTGNWNINSVGITNYGTTGDLPVPMDYNGDGKTDYAVFRPSDGGFHISGVALISWGTAGDIPVPGDYDGDGKADCAVWRPSTLNWYIKRTGDGTDTTINYGIAGDILTPGDYNGDGKVDISVWRSSGTPVWLIHGQTSVTYGAAGDIPVPGDYDGDGVTDIALFRPSSGSWFIYGGTSVTAITPIATGDIPVPGDYFGDGLTHPAIYRPSTHTLYTWNGTLHTTVLGSAPAGKPVNLPYCIRQAYTLLH